MVRFRHRAAGLALAATALSFAAPSAAQAQSFNGVAYAGTIAGDGLSAYAGAVTALPGGRLGKGLALRGSVVGGRYRYTLPGGRINGDYIGGEIALVQQFSGDWGWANLSAGPRVINTSLSPADPSNRRQGTRFDAAVQADGGLALSPGWRLVWLGSWGMNDSAYLARASLGRLLNSNHQTRLGPELTLQGDPRYRTVNAGLFISSQLARNFEVQLSGGASLQSRRKALPYAALNLVFLY